MAKRGGKGKPSGKTYGPQTNPPIVVPQTPPVVVIQRPPQQPPQVVQTPEERRRRREYENIPQGQEEAFFGKELDNWQKHLEEHEKQKDAVKAYTGTSYIPMNRHLRGIDKIDVKTNPYGQKTLDRIKELDKAIAKFDLKKDIVLYRGSTADLIGGLKTVEDIKKRIGSEVQDKGFMSTATNKGAAFSGEIKYEVHVPKGKGRGAYLGLTSHYGKIESEFLLARGTKFRITGVKEVGTFHKQVVVELQVIGKSKK